MPKSKFERSLNRVFNVALVVFVVGVGVTLNRFILLNESAIETAYFPVVEDYTFRDWRQEPDGTWSAVVYIYKARPECQYIKDQILTYTGITPDGETAETTFTSIGDETVGSNRGPGWQRLDDRQKFNSAAFQWGTRFRGSILHQCREGKATTSLTGDHTVGIEDPYPPYVRAWFENNQAGSPTNYR